MELTEQEKADMKQYLKDIPKAEKKSEYFSTLYNEVGSEGHHNTRCFVNLAVRAFKKICADG